MDRDVTRLLGEPPPGVFSRRSFFRVAAGSALAIGTAGPLAACGSSSSSGASGQGGSVGKVGGPLNIFTWQGYDLSKPFGPWKKQHHITENVKYLNNQFDVSSLLRSQNGKQYDSSTANQAYTNLFQSLGIMSKITVDEVPSLADLYDFFRTDAMWQWGDGSGAFNSVPWTWGALGINYLEGKVPKPTSYDVFIDPKNKGRVGTFDDGYNNVSVAAIALGFDLTKISPAQLNGPIKNWLTKMVRNCKSISPSLADQATLLVNGEVDYMQIGNELISQLAKQQGGTGVAFTIPKEGGFGFTDAAFVTPFAPHRANALAWCEALIAPETAALAANFLVQAPTNPKAVPHLNAAAKALVPYDRADDYIKHDLKLRVNYTGKSGPNIINFDQINQVWEQVKSA